MARKTRETTKSLARRERDDEKQNDVKPVGETAVVQSRGKAADRPRNKATSKRKHVKAEEMTLDAVESEVSALPKKNARTRLEGSGDQKKDRQKQKLPKKELSNSAIPIASSASTLSEQSSPERSKKARAKITKKVTSPYFKDKSSKTVTSSTSPQKQLSGIMQRLAPSDLPSPSKSLSPNIEMPPLVASPTKEMQLEQMKKYAAVTKRTENHDSDSESDCSDWEEVAEMPHFTEPLPLPKVEEEKAAVQVVVEAPDPLGRKK